ncbi:Uncharacterised protein [Raoultella planticola]|uniref:hypothetical protein n=1 Tax=Raoultella planticola TaxID=575 RepID=UPI000D8F6302|nr:hypothetical protein [Raoultella planticola]SQA60510.1 Uncharacterised protein [Raoultella planticola]
MRKHKGDVTYYLEKEGDSYRLIKKVKARTNVTNGNKTTKITYYDCLLAEHELLNLDFTLNGLRADDETAIKTLIMEFKQNENQ